MSTGMKVKVIDSRPRPKGDGTTGYCSLMEGMVFSVVVFVKGGVGCVDWNGKQVERDGYLLSASNLIWDVDRFEIVEAHRPTTPSQLVGFKSPRPPKVGVD